MSEPPLKRDPRMLHTRPLPRLLALLGLGLVFVFYRPGADPDLLQSVLLPLIALAAVWYLSGSIVAVAFGVMLLALAHSDRSSDMLLESTLYPALALLAALILLLRLGQRFRLALHQRRAQRRAQRQGDQAANRDGDPPQP